MRPKMVDSQGKKLRVGYIVKMKEHMRNFGLFKVIRQSKKGNIVIESLKHANYTTVMHPSHLTKMKLEDLI